MRARMALAASGQIVDLREVELRNRPDELYAASPKGTVPVLVLPDGQVVDESLEIMHWALEKSDPLAWLPATVAMKSECDALLARNDGAFKHHLDRYKYATRYEDVDEVEHREKAALILYGLEERLQQSTFLLGDDFTLADAAVVPFVRQYSLADRAYFDSQGWSALRVWLDRFTSSERFLAMMEKYPVWKSCDEPRAVDWR
jgi:glutathione S-transferase